MSVSRTIACLATTILSCALAACSSPEEPASTARSWPISRPVDQSVGPDGALYINDDRNGTIYRISYREEADG